METRSARVKKWRTRTKTKLVECFGGQCNRCNYNLCLDALDFHHINNKKFDISSVMSNPRKWDVVVAEVKKCVLLCCRCHRELHCGLWNLNEISIIEPKFVDKPTIAPTGKCPICGNNVFGTITCSRVCAAKRSNKCQWPSKDEMINLKKIYSRVEIADKLGVSEAAVRKHERKIFPCLSIGRKTGC